MGCGCCSKLADDPVAAPVAASVAAVVAVVKPLLEELGGEPFADGGDEAHARKLQATFEKVNNELASLFNYTQV